MPQKQLISSAPQNETCTQKVPPSLPRTPSSCKFEAVLVVLCEICLARRRALVDCVPGAREMPAGHQRCSQARREVAWHEARACYAAPVELLPSRQPPMSVALLESNPGFVLPQQVPKHSAGNTPSNSDVSGDPTLWGLTIFASPTDFCQVLAAFAGDLVVDRLEELVKVLPEKLLCPMRLHASVLHRRVVWAEGDVAANELRSWRHCHSTRQGLLLYRR